MKETQQLESLVTLSVMQVQLLAEIKSVLLKQSYQSDEQHKYSLSNVVDLVRHERFGVVKALSED